MNKKVVALGVVVIGACIALAFVCGEKSVVKNQVITSDSEYYYSILDKEVHAYKKDERLTLEDVSFFMQENLVLMQGGHVVFRGTPKDAAQSKFANCEILEIAVCEDEETTLTIFIGRN